MSFKSAKNKSHSSPRAMPVETIITRYKSAQQKKQTDKKEEKREQKNVKITDKIKSISKKCDKTNNNKRNKKCETAERVETKEYYPHKLKRPSVNKKVVLAPKHRYKMVGCINGSSKRKLHVPQKDIKYASTKEKNLNPSDTLDCADDDTNHSIIEMIKMIEENGSLEEEDFLEILTCPSPVWWEDPPDGFTEDSIFIGTGEKNITEINAENKAKQSVDRSNVDNTKDNNSKSNMDLITISISKRDDNFTHRRSKLESLLTSIKNKRNKDKDIENNTKSNHVSNVLKVSENMDVVESNNSLNREKKTSESDCDILELRDDEFLTELENMEIPIEQAIKTEGRDVEKETASYFAPRNNLMDSKEQLYEEYLEMSVFDDESNVESKDNTDNCEMDFTVINLQNGVNNVINTIEDNGNSLRSSLCDSTTKRNFGSINPNKTAKKYSELNNQIEGSTKETFNKDKEIDKTELTNERNKYVLTNDKKDVSSEEYVTVYQILSHDNEDIKESKISDSEIKNEVNKSDSEKLNSKINCYYKQCKNIKKNKKFNTKTDSSEDRKKLKHEVCDSCSSDSRCILISDSDVKYCMECSSIFDTDHCKYCVKRSKLQTFTCDKCSFNTDTKIKISEHLHNCCDDLHNTNHEHMVD